MLSTTYWLYNNIQEKKEEIEKDANEVIQAEEVINEDVEPINDNDENDTEDD